MDDQPIVTVTAEGTYSTIRLLSGLYETILFRPSDSHAPDPVIRTGMTKQEAHNAAIEKLRGR
jgi:hypothetical protein